MEQQAFQTLYPAELSHCYGCGKLNQHGLQIKSYWEGEETIAEVQPEPFHIGMQGFVYGGLIASIIDCHSTATAAAASYRAENRAMDTKPVIHFVTGALHVDYLKPTPIGVALKIRSKIKEIKGRKTIITSTLSANGEICARGEVIAVQMPKEMIPVMEK